MAIEDRFTFLSNDEKTTVSAVSWIPDNEEYDIVLQITHGMVEFIDRYKPFAEFLTQHGIMVVGHDHIGHGDSVQSKDDWGYFAEENPSDILINDMHKLRSIVQSENADIPYFMLGHSMGSYLLRKYLCVYGEDLTGAIIMGTGYIPDNTIKFGMAAAKTMAKMHGWHYRSSFLKSLSFSGSYKKYDITGKNPRNSWLTKDPEIVKWYYSEPKCTYTFTVNGYMGMFEAILFDNQIKNIKKMPEAFPLLFVSGKEDPVGDCGDGIKKVLELYQKAGLKDLSARLYENDRHEILNETDKETVYNDILKWINKKANI